VYGVNGVASNNVTNRLLSEFTSSIGDSSMQYDVRSRSIIEVPHPRFFPESACYDLTGNLYNVLSIIKSGRVELDQITSDSDLLARVIRKFSGSNPTIKELLDFASQEYNQISEIYFSNERNPSIRSDNEFCVQPDTINIGSNIC
jgi:hypothetical protein